MYGLRLTCVLLMLVGCASAPIRERCGLVMTCAPLPEEAQDFAEIDGMLVRRAADMAVTARGLKYFMGDFYKREFLEQLLPQLCDRLEAARALAAKGERQEAGARYQALAIVAEVMAVEVALAQVGDYADRAGEPSVSVIKRLTDYERDMAPLMAAALSNDRDRLAVALRDGAAKHAEWRWRLDAWARALQLGTERVEVAHKLWSTSLAIVAVYQMAGAAAEIAASSGPPLALGAVAGSGGAAVVVNRATVEALGQLLLSKAMDPVIVAGLAQMSGVSPGEPPVTGARPEALGRGSTADAAKGTAPARNLREQLAIEQATANPQAGRALDTRLADPRWPASEGWVKMQQSIKPGGQGGPINVHYVYNRVTGQVDDFKIVLRPQP